MANYSNFDQASKQAAANGATDRNKLAMEGVLAGNGADPDQVQLKADGCTDLMFIREHVGGSQMGTITINSSGKKFRSGTGLRIRSVDTSGFGHGQVETEPELESRILKLWPYANSASGVWTNSIAQVVNYTDRLITYGLPPGVLPPGTVIPYEEHEYTVSVDIPANTRGLPFIARLWGGGSVSVVGMSWIAEDGHEIPITGEILRNFAPAAPTGPGSESCSYTYSYYDSMGVLQGPFTNTLTLQTFTSVGTSPVCPQDFTNWGVNWVVYGNNQPESYPQTYPALYPGGGAERPAYRTAREIVLAEGSPPTFNDPPHNYTVFGGRRTHLFDYKVLTRYDPSLDYQPYQTYDGGANYISVLNDGVPGSSGGGGATVLPSDYYGGQTIRYIFYPDSGLLPPPPFTTPANPDGYASTATLKVRIGFSYGYYFQDYYYNPPSDETEGHCVTRFQRSVYDAAWAAMDAGEGWRIGKGGAVLGMWLGGWVGEATEGQPISSRPFIYAYKPCETSGEGGGASSTYFP